MTQFDDLTFPNRFVGDFRTIKAYVVASPFIRDVLITSLRRLELGEPQLRVHFEEIAERKLFGVFGLQKPKVREFALERDWESPGSPEIKLVFYEKTQEQRIVDKFIQLNVHYEATEKIYLCVKVTPDYDLCCWLGATEDKKPVIEFGEVWRRGKYEFKSCYEMREDQRTEKHIKEGLNVALEMIAASASYFGMSPLSEHIMQGWAISRISERLDNQDESV